MDKRHVYEWDTKIHLLARGPGIAPGTTWSEGATQVDLAPTILAIAGAAPAPQHDGKSLLPLLINKRDAEVAMRGDTTISSSSTSTSTSLPETVRKHLHALSAGSPAAYRAAWRQAVYFCYFFVNTNIKCTGSCSKGVGGYPSHDANCGLLGSEPNSQCWSPPDAGCKNPCYATESLSNNFIAIRSLKGSAAGNSLYAEYQTGDQRNKNIEFDAVDFREYYDMDKDPWQMNNLLNSTSTPSTPVPASLKAELDTFFKCAGSTCP